VIPAMGASSRLFCKVNEPIVSRLSIRFKLSGSDFA
jgi:hypothetical protein